MYVCVCACVYTCIRLCAVLVYIYFHIFESVFNLLNPVKHKREKKYCCKCTHLYTKYDLYFATYYVCSVHLPIHDYVLLFTHTSVSCC